MKKKLLHFFCVLVLLFGGTTLCLATPVELDVEIEDPTGTLPGHGKSPVQIPSLWQDGYELTFLSEHPAYALDIVLNGIVVYSTNVSETTTTVFLPSWLSGEYELQLYPEDCSYYFYGYVTL